MHTRSRTGQSVRLAIVTVSVILLMIVGMAHQVSAVPAGKYFDHVVLIAMENQGYADVLGDGHGTSSAPFLAGFLAKSSTTPDYHSGLSPGCSEGCYIQLVAGDDYGASNGVTGINAKSGTIFGRFDSAGITWQAFCESGCPRGGDHFPFLAINGLDVPSKVNADATTADFVAALNSAAPPNFAWFTPTDSHNMHDNSVSSGDAYLKTFLVGTGTIDSPAQGSLLASNVFKPGMRTVLVLWWDEYDPAPYLIYGETARKGYISAATDQNIYSTTHTFLDNWELASLTNNDASAPMQTDYFSNTGSPPSSPPPSQPPPSQPPSQPTQPPLIPPITTIGMFDWLPVLAILVTIVAVTLAASKKRASPTRGPEKRRSRR